MIINVSFLGSGQGRKNEFSPPKTARPPSDLSTYNDEDNCSHCGASGKPTRFKKMSCWSLIFLLAVDAFTIGLLLVLYSHSLHHNGEYKN